MEKRKAAKIEDIARIFDRCTYRVNKQELFSDVFELGAIAVSNSFCLSRQREERFLNIKKKYDDKTFLMMREAFNSIFLLLTNQIDPSVGFRDYLGELYMMSGTSSDSAGQFFTPYNISYLCASTSIDKEFVSRAMDSDKIITIREPSVGAGGMVIAAADVLFNNFGFNIGRNLFIECGDIDKRCVHMTYLQIGLAGIPAIVYHWDELTSQTWDAWVTPAYVLQYPRFRKFANGRK